MASEEVFDLLKIGLTEGEAKVYVALSELGSSTVGPIVQKSGVAYSNVYDILNRLIEKGIVSFIIKAKTKYFQAVSPSNLFDYLEDKEKEIINQKNSLKKILPELEKLQGVKPQQSAEIFLGKKGLKTAYEKLLSGATKNDENLFFYIHEKEYAKESDLFYFSINEILKKVSMRGICNEGWKDSDFLKDAKYLDLRYVEFPIPGNMEVCKDKILLVSWEKPVTATLIHSQSIANNLRTYFNDVWRIAKKAKR